MNKQIAKKLISNAINVILPWLFFVSLFLFRMLNLKIEPVLQELLIYIFIVPLSLFLYSHLVLSKNKWKYIYAIYNPFIFILVFFRFTFEPFHKMNNEQIVFFIAFTLFYLFWSILPLLAASIRNIFCVLRQKRINNNDNKSKTIVKKIILNTINIIFPWALFIPFYKLCQNDRSLGDIENIAKVVFIFVCIVPICLFLYSLAILRSNKFRYVYAIYNALVYMFIFFGHLVQNEVVTFALISLFYIFWSIIPLLISSIKNMFVNIRQRKLNANTDDNV